MRKKLLVLLMACLLAISLPIAVHASVSTGVKTSSIYAETTAISTTTYISVSATNCAFKDNYTGNTTCYTTGSGLPTGQSGTVAGTARIGGVTYSGATSAISS